MPRSAGRHCLFLDRIEIPGRRLPCGAGFQACKQPGWLHGRMPYERSRAKSLNIPKAFILTHQLACFPARPALPKDPWVGAAQKRGILRQATSRDRSIGNVVSKMVQLVPRKTAPVFRRSGNAPWLGRSWGKIAAIVAQLNFRTPQKAKLRVIDPKS